MTCLARSNAGGGRAPPRRRDARDGAPHPMCTIDADGVRHALLPGVNGTVRRQDMPPVYRANVAIYVNDAGEIDLDTSFNDNEVGFVMSAGRSVDIDDLEDFARAERMLEEG